MRKNIAIFVISLVISCAQTEEAAIFTQPSGQINIQHTSLDSKSITIDSVVFSIATDMRVANGRLIFIDKVDCHAYLYATTGKFIAKKLGSGRSNNEVPSSEITGFGISETGNYVVFSDVECFIFDSTFKQIERCMLPVRVKETPADELQGCNPMIYSWAHRNFTIRAKETKIFMSADLRRIDQIKDKDKYYNEGRTIMQIESTTGMPDFVFARYPNTYKENNLQQFNQSSFDLGENGDFFVSFEADSLIYQYDKDYNQINTFGNAGKNMSTDYKSIVSSPNLYQQITNERETKGFYEAVEYIPQYNVLLRLYRRGVRDADSDGLQLYRGNDLIADIDIAKGSKMAGYSYPYIYLYKMDSIGEQMEVVKLKYDNQ